jgi:hypothetical protein
LAAWSKVCQEFFHYESNSGSPEWFDLGAAH